MSSREQNFVSVETSHSGWVMTWTLPKMTPAQYMYSCSQTLAKYAQQAKGIERRL